ncbi:MAG: hypothetical protein DWQ04_09215 [Chloroflexi bacterium]|nr:MAG: hypothetical protein DWQ04_09215 [Chloroflexota bacterium]
MDYLKQWWANDLPTGVKFVFLVLLANAVPAILILMSLPNMTEQLFVWTVKPAINARLMGVMYANALLLIGVGVFQTSWARVRIIMVVITLFSILATVLTFFYLKPFLAHPWFHLTYWLSMYLVLFFAAPYVFATHEKKYGGRLPIQMPLNNAARLLATLFLITSLICSLTLLFQVDAVNQALPWTLPPLVGGLIGVLFMTHTAAYAWALWDGDWLRVRPIFWQAPATGLLFILLPLLHPSDLRSDVGNALTLYYTLAGLVVLASFSLIISYRTTEQKVPRHA